MKLVVANQKAYMTLDDINIFSEKTDSLKANNFVLCPSSVYLYKFIGSGIKLGSQTVSNFPKGANTGDVTCEQLKSCGVSFCLVGHSERREKGYESIPDTNIKINKLLSSGIIPILCVGETKGERDLGNAYKTISLEIEGALKDLSTDFVDKIIIAYEPIWSIGSGLIPTSEEIYDTVNYIKNLLQVNYQSTNLVLYGGSVNSSNIDELNVIANVDGYLIGGASTKIDELISIVDKCK